MDSNQKLKIGFIGIGNMGMPMASRLIHSGFEVIAFDARPLSAQAFVKANPNAARVASSLKSLASESDVVITMLPDSRIVGKVLFEGADSVASGLKLGALVIEMSSGVPSQTAEFANHLKAQQVELIDAPVSGGVARAETGQLAIMVGADDQAFSKAEPILKAMGTSIVRAGAVGSGQAAKALNNLVSAAGLLISIEALLVAQKSGLNPEVMVDVLNASSGMTNSSQKKLKQFVLSRSFASGFGLDLMVKDLSIALEVARETKTATPLASLVRELWACSAQTLGPGQDHTAITKQAESFANVTLGLKP